MKSSPPAHIHWKLINRWDISQLSGLSQFCELYLKSLPPHSIVLLNGPMAVGKSELVRQYLLQFDLNSKSSSPTFALHHRHSFSARTVDHWDLYRLNNEDELEGSGFWDLLSAADSTVFIEWANKIREDWLPKNRPLIKIDFEFRGNFREISVYQAA